MGDYANKQDFNCILRCKCIQHIDFNSTVFDKHKQHAKKGY
jgi:hypothetical protein